MSANAGRRGARWRRLCADVKARARRGEVCCRCGQRIDCNLEWPDPASCSTDHFPHPLSTHPHLAEEPTNLAPAHLSCNSSAGNKGRTPSIGAVSETW